MTRKKLLPALLATAALLLSQRTVPAQDLPHAPGQNIDCMSCHLDHDVFGNMVGTSEGSPNLCMSCHQSGGLASRKPFADKQQSTLQPGSPAQAGSSHRWDSSLSGRIEPLAGAPDVLMSSGVYTGAYAADYTITISVPGTIGAARLNWTRTGPQTGSGTAVLMETNALDQGIVITFRDTTNSLPAGAQWRLHAFAGLNMPTNADLLACMPGNKVLCSTCHDAHSQESEPFDSKAPAYVAGGGQGRHNLRVDNATDQMCAECHRSLFTTNSGMGSHPVGMLVSSNATLHPPKNLPLDKQLGMVRCETCHQPHNAPGPEGALTRMNNNSQLCAECHAVASTAASPASHLNPMSGPLWPGGEYGSLKPADSNINNRGSCSTCHEVHGWPDATATANAYPTLLVEREENLCYTCHDGGQASNVRSVFSKTYTHPVALSGRHTVGEDGISSRYGISNRHSECADCHNVHQLTPDAVAPTPPFASSSLAGLGRVSVRNLSTTSISYTFRAATDPTPTKEYELCYLCHSGWTTQPTTQTNFAAKFNDLNPSFHPVEAVGKNLNINPITFTNGWTETSLTYCTDCHTSDDKTIRGPHGSAYPWILKKPYAKVTSPALSADGICFDCHSYAVYGANVAGSRFRNVSRTGHNHGGYNCFACHESHGSSTKPFLLGNNVSIYTKTATGGTCDPSCHGSESYTAAYPR